MSVVARTENLTRVLSGEVPVTLVENIDLEIRKGEFVAIMGPSGSGKSPLLYLLGLLDMPTSGKVWIDGVDTAGLDEDRLASLRLKKLGFVFQFHFLLADFSALDNVCLPMSRLGRLSEEEIAGKGLRLLDSFGLKKHAGKRPSQMSGGERQRVAVAVVGAAARWAGGLVLVRRTGRPGHDPGPESCDRRTDRRTRPAQALEDSRPGLQSRQAFFRDGK